jgi:hypothetical protein
MPRKETGMTIQEVLLTVGAAVVVLVLPAFLLVYVASSEHHGKYRHPPPITEQGGCNDPARDPDLRNLSARAYEAVCVD